MSDDVMIAELTSFGSASEDDDDIGSAPSGTRRRSRFFFRLSDQIVSEEDQRIADAATKKELPQSDRDIVNRSKVYSKELPKSILPMVEEVREFFLHELAPKAMAAGVGVVQAESVIEVTTGSEVNEITGRTFMQMVSMATNIRMSRKVAEYMGLSVEDAELLLNKINPTKEVIFMNASPQHPVRGMENGPKANESGGAG